MEFFSDNLEIFLPIIAILIDVLMGSIDNSKFKYKGIVLRIAALIGDAADNALKHDSAKKIVPLVLIVPFLFATVAMAEVATWMTPAQVNVSWDPVTTTVNEGVEEPLPSNATIQYEVFVAKEDKANPVSLWKGPETTAFITPKDGGFSGPVILAIETIMLVDGTEVERSPKGWSDDPTVVSPTGGTFGFMLYFPPNSVKGFTFTQ